MTRATQLAEAARKYRDNHHWVPLVLKDGKNPGYAGWQKHKLEDAIPRNSTTTTISASSSASRAVIWFELDPDFAAIPAVFNILFPEPR